MNQRETSEALREQRVALMEYLWALPEAAWEKPSLCAGWTVRDVVAHLVGNAADINALRLEGIGSESYNQRQIDERAGRSIAELMAEWDEQGEGFEKNMLEQTDEFWNADYPPFGTVGTALKRIVEDLYIHTQDIRVALGEDVVDGAGLIPTLEVMAQELPGRAARLVPDVGAIEFDVAGFSDRVAVGVGSSVRVSGDAKVLAFVATGRTRLDDAVSSGSLAVAPSVPSGLGDALNVYGP
jgi:uncharacterized protein (TIGR03083 family)